MTKLSLIFIAVIMYLIGLFWFAGKFTDYTDRSGYDSLKMGLLGMLIYLMITAGIVAVIGIF